MNRSKIFTAMALLLVPTMFFSACKKSVKVPGLGEDDKETSVRANESVSIWMTTADRSRLLQQQSNVTFGPDAGTNSNTITIDEGTSYQDMDGFGFTLTQGSAQLIKNMAAAQQNALLNELFSPSGIGLSALRISIGASDLSTHSYSYRDGASFSLAGPDLDDLIPIIKKILVIQPNIKILATPWSAPRWMKTNGGWVGGSLNLSNYGDYATYFLDYLNAMRNQGINIWGITPQNEPENPHNEPSMLMTANEQLNFIQNHLGPRIRNAGYNTKIIGFDHNCDNTSYPITVANGSSYVDGSAFHLYSGNISAMSTVRNATNKNVYFTEQWTSSTGNFGGDLSWHTQNITIGASRNWAKAIFEWNLANNTNMGPRTPGGCTQCLGAITISNSTTYSRNVAYYIIAHLSKFVNPGALRISSNATSGFQNVAFKNPDGSKVLLVLNTSGSTGSFKVRWGTQSFTYSSLPAGAVATFKWSNAGGSGSVAPIGQVVSLRGFNNQFVSGENGVGPMWCNRLTAGDWERFTVVDAGDGKVALRSMGKYLSSENGAAAITCSKTVIGDWEKFDWVVNPDGKISLRGNNGRYISSENGANAMTCTRTTISGWEAFSL